MFQKFQNLPKLGILILLFSDYLFTTSRAKFSLITTITISSNVIGVVAALFFTNYSVEL